MKHSSFDATISALDAETSALDVETSAFAVWGSDVGDRAEVIRCDDNGAAGCRDIGARCGDVGARRVNVGDRAELPIYQRYRRGVSSDCGVGITPQMCNRVTNHGDMSTFSKPAHLSLIVVYIEFA